MIYKLLYDTDIFVKDLSQKIYDILLSFGINKLFIDLLFQLIIASIVVLIVMLNALWIIYYERRLAARIQVRIGPNRVGPFGLLQTIADTIKLQTKEDINPSAADKLPFWAAPFIVFVPSFAIFIVMPFGKGLIPADISIGLLYIVAISGLGVIGILCAGWGSNSKYSLIGAIRSAAQIISYEIPMLMIILTITMLSGSMKVSDIVNSQLGYKWFIFKQFFGFIIFVIVANAEINRSPFDLPEAESELVAGFNTEYSAMKFSFFYLAEYTNLFIVSAIGVTLFFGGWEGPVLPHFIWFIIKTYLFVTFMIWIRWSFPRIRVDHLMKFSWKYAFPLSLINFMITALLIKIF